MHAKDTALVVGSGPNGLAAAVLLARAGLRVEVHEASDTVGGGARTLPLTLPGYVHDVCSAIHPMAVASPYFRKLRLEDHGLEWIEPPIALAHPFDDGTAAVLLRSVDETAESLGPDGRAYRRLMKPFVDRWLDLVGGTLGPLLRPPRHPFLMARLGWFGLRSALSLVESQFEGERARALFLGIAGHTLMPLTKAPTSAFGLMLAIVGHGAGWPLPRGGSGRISAALEKILLEHGGHVRTCSEVVSLDDLPPAAVTMLDLTPRQVLAVAGGRITRRYCTRLRRYRYGPGSFKCDWALSEPIPWTAPECRRAGTVHLGATPEQIVASADAAWEGRHDDTPFTLLTQPSLFDPTRAPEGGHVAWAYCHVPHASTRDMSDAIERQIERFAPGFRDTILARHTFSPVELERYNPNMVGGDINGGVQDLAQLVFRPVPRLDPYTTPAEGLFVCSSSTPPGGGVHGMCGYNASRSALAYLAIPSPD